MSGGDRFHLISFLHGLAINDFFPSLDISTRAASSNQNGRSEIEMAVPDSEVAARLPK